MDALDEAGFRQFQLGLVSALASPGLFPTLQSVARMGAAAASADLAATLAQSGLALSPGVSIKSVLPEAEGLVILVCVDFGSGSHCTSIKLQSPIVFD